MVLIKADTKLKLGAPSRIRTYDLQIRSLSLYPAELWAQTMERKTRFELATFAMARRRSTTEPLPLIFRNISHYSASREKWQVRIGADEEI